MKKTVQLLAALLLFASAPAQPYYFRHYQVENGLSNNTVYCSLQDKSGFMWFGTKDGLNRFDGYHFKTFSLASAEQSNLTGAQVEAMTVDRQGTLWVGLRQGLYFFDARREQLLPFIDSLTDVHALHFDGQGQLWFIAGHSVYRYNFQSRVLTPIVAAHFTAVSLTEVSGAIWVSSTNGFLHRFDAASNTFRAYNVFSHSPRAESYNIEKIAPAGNGALFIATSNQGIKQFDIATETYKDLLTYNADRTTLFVRDILEASPNEFWFATESGLYIFNRQTGKFTHLVKNHLDPYSLSDNAVYTLYKDREGGIWAGTYFGGLNYFPRPYSFFQKYFPDNSDRTISGNAVREICADQTGHVWIGTEDAGLNEVNIRTGAITHFKPTGSPTSIAYSNIHGLLVVKDKLWVGTFEHGLDILDIASGKVVKHYMAGPGARELKSNFIVTFLQTKDGEIYAGTSNGLSLYDAGSDGFLPVKQLPEGGFISVLLEDHNGTIWTGTHDNGLYYFNPHTSERGHFLHATGNKNSLSNNTINALYEDSALNLWIATEGGGLCRLSADRRQFTTFSTDNGLPSNFVFKVLEDNKKSLWVTTSKGLVNMDTQGQRITTYTKAKGLLNDQFNYNSGFKDDKGKLYFGSVSGMITFNPDSFTENPVIPPIYITALQVQNKEVTAQPSGSILKQSILYTDYITLPYDQSTFSIDFAALSFTAPEMTEYSYIMDGLDKEWTNLKANRKVYFTNLAPGHYTFRVKAGNNGHYSAKVSTLHLLITPPFWATLWAYLAYAVAAGLMLYYVIRTYHRIQENKRNKEVYEAKIEFFTNIAHEIKTPLTLIKGPVENLHELTTLVPEIREEVVTMERNTNRLVNLINQVLDFRQIEKKAFSLELSAVNLNDLLSEAYETFLPVATKRKLAYLIELPPTAVSIMADSEAMTKVLHNLFSNAVKYADREVMVRLHSPAAGAEAVTIEISNDGLPIAEEMKDKIFEPFFRIKTGGRQKGTGLGLALVKSLVELHSGQVYLKDQSQKLNTFIVQLPFKSKTKSERPAITIVHL